jgi:hypothetical protein
MLRIYYFGGYHATQQNVDAWKASVEEQLLEVDVIAFPYPDGASTSPLPTWGTDNVDKWADRIAHQSDVEETIIIGHSSGCQLSNAVARELMQVSDSFRLIALDGFCPSPELLAMPKTMVWSAECRGVKSRNYVYCQNKAGPRFHVYQAKVQEQWPLHFSLVNVNVSDDHPSLLQGYVNCRANIEVLGLVE